MNIKHDVMSRVRTVRGVRMIAASPVVSGLFGAVLICCLSILVSVGHVFANTMAYADWSDRFAYAFSSLLRSRVIVQALAALIISACSISFINSVRRIPVRKILVSFFSFGSTQQV